MKNGFYKQPAYFLALLLWVLACLPFYSQATLRPGDLAVIGFNASQSSSTKDFTLLALAGIAKDEEILITDRGWSVAGCFIPLVPEEGTIYWKVKSNVPAGSIIRISITAGNSRMALAQPSAVGDLVVMEGWTVTGANSPWGKEGDQIIIYQGTPEQPHFIYAFSTSSNKADAATTGHIRGWQQSVTHEAHSSLLPPGLFNATGSNPATALTLSLSPLGGMHNQVYRGGRKGTKTKLLEAIGNTMNWEGNNFQPYDLKPGGIIFDATNPFVISATTFPVHLLTFSGSKTSNGHLLRWELAHEETYATYLIEKSSNGREFSPVASIAAVGGAYNYTVPNFNGGQQYYRLKLLDVDSNYAYSRSILLLGNRQKLKLQTFPNPVTDMVNISCADPIIEVQITNFSGRYLFTKKLDHPYIATISIQSLPAGNYFIQVKTEKDVLAKGIIKR